MRQIGSALKFILKILFILPKKLMVEQMAKAKSEKPKAEDGTEIMACYLSMKYRVHPIN